jgi:hypothetical protein
MVTTINNNDMPASLKYLYDYKAGEVQYTLYSCSDASFEASSLTACFLWVGAKPETDPQFNQAWQTRGLYVFIPLATAPAAWDAIAANLYALYKQGLQDGLRFAWTNDTGYNLLASINIQGDNVQSAGSFAFSQMELSFPTEGIKLAAADDFTQIVFSGQGMNFIPDIFNADVLPVPITSVVTLSVLNGIFNFGMDLNVGQLADCNAGLHYYYSEEKISEESDIPVTWYSAFNYPILKPTASISTQVSLDFRNPQNGNRTKIELKGTDAIPSLMSTTAGRFLELQPSTDGRTAFNGFGLVNYPDGIQETGKLCFNLQGSFRMLLPGSGKLKGKAAAAQLLCGLSGTEHIQFLPASNAYAGDLMEFIPGKSAYAPDFPIPVNGSVGVSNAESLLSQNDYCTTSWVQVINTAPLDDKRANSYFSQPQGAPLFLGSGDAGKAKFLDLFNAEAGATFDAGLIGSTPKCFPMVPYGGVLNGDSSTLYTEFERQIINPRRKQLIVTRADIKVRDDHSKLLFKNNAIASEGNRLITTPQGLLVRVIEEEGRQNWVELLLAIDKTLAARLSGLMITNLNATQRSAFQTNQQFLVVSKEDSFGKIGGRESDGSVFRNSVSVAGWPFYFKVGKNQYGDFSNVLIFKFCPGSLADKASNSSSWTQAQDFVGDDDTVGQLSRWLQSYISKVDELVQTEPSYNYIHKIIHDANWNGMLALNVDISVKDFPQDLKGLLGGMDLARFKAHHFGVEMNAINMREGHIAVPNCSSMFGLIDYNDDLPSVATDQNFDFKVLKLRVLFKNSNIIDFNSKVNLTVNKLFGDDIKTGLKTILLNGTYENHDGKNTYIFNAVENTRFTLNSNVLQAIDFTKVQFTTLNNENTDKTEKPDKAEDVKSKFSVWGKMQFADLKGMDAFSFNQLAFGALDIKMDFSMDDPSNRTFTFDPSGMTFDMLNSVARQKSLAMNFPISLSTVTAGDGTKMPKDSNFLSVTSPLDEYSQPFTTAWYGLTFNVNLGSAGALATQGGFTAKFLVAWCATAPDAEKDDHAAAIFFQLPGAGKSEGAINLQSVLKLSVGGIALYADDKGTEGIAYLLKFNKIVADIFGKKLPPSGNTEFFLFGDPKRTAQIADPVTSSMGWYASYQKEKKKY